MKKELREIHTGVMTGDDHQYQYRDSNVPRARINYSYSLFQGEHFLKIWANDRAKFIGDLLPSDPATEYDHDETQTGSIFIEWIRSLQEDRFNKYEELDLLLKRFEVSKRVYGEYDEHFRPASYQSNYGNLHLYLLFSYILISAYKKTKRLTYLNGLLKANDIGTSVAELLQNRERRLLAFNLQEELSIIESLGRRTSK